MNVDSCIRTAVIYARYTTVFSYFDDWLDSISGSALFDSIAFDANNREELDRLKKTLGEFDAIIVLHSLTGDSLNAAHRITNILCARKCPLLMFVGNEVNLPGIKLSDKRAWIREVSPEYIGTQLLVEAGEYLFEDLVSKSILPLPHALNPATFQPRIKLSNRKNDIGVITARYLPHLGDDDRNRINDYFRDNADSLNLLVNISNKRLDRSGWAGFLNNSRGTVSTEAGSWFLEKDDHTVEEIRSWVMNTSEGGITVSDDSWILKFYNRLPKLLRQPAKLLKRFGLARHEISLSEDVAYQAVYERFFADYPKPSFYGKCISSRHFDAVGTNTVQILFPGRYNDILQADRHYISLNPDFSNIQEVLYKFSDLHFVEEITQTARDYVLENHTYAHRMQLIHSKLTQA